MTEQPPGPPPGFYPPPGGGFPPPGGYPPPGYGMSPFFNAGALPTAAYTPWISRAISFLIDYVPYLIIIGIGWGVLLGTQECVDPADNELAELLGQSYAEQSCSISTVGQTAAMLSLLIGFAYVLWNHGYRQGTTGSSIGKSLLKFKVIGEKTGQPIGFGPSIVRQVIHMAVDALICGVGFLFPLWDNKRQTLADKLMSTVCLPI